jgi:DNA-binding protein H-NS
MARQSRLASLSVGALVKMRDEIGSILGRRADALKKELRALGEDYKEVGRIAIYGRKKSGKVAAKYRHPKTGETWAGRGAQPRWLTAEIKAGKKRDDFLIAKGKARKKRKAKA